MRENIQKEGIEREKKDRKRDMGKERKSSRFLAVRCSGAFDKILNSKNVFNMFITKIYSQLQLKCLLTGRLPSKAHRMLRPDYLVIN